jgi:hypothetical protein
VPPQCSATDAGACATACKNDATCVASCQAGASGFAPDLSTDCPPVAALKAVEKLVQMTNTGVFTCFDFDCASGKTLAECAQFKKDKGAYEVPLKSRTCSLPELITSFKDAGDTLQTAMSDMETAGNDFAPKIGVELRELIDAKMVKPFLAIIDAKTMNCGFLVTAWESFLDGACYNLGGALAYNATIFTRCAYCGFLLVFLIFGLWRYFIDMFDLNKGEGYEVGAKAAWG